MALIERGGSGGGAFLGGLSQDSTPMERSKGWLEVRGKRAVIVREADLDRACFLDCRVTVQTCMTTP